MCHPEGEAWFKRTYQNDLINYCLGPTVPVLLRRDDFTHPDTVSPVAGFEYITDDHPPDCAWVHATWRRAPATSRGA